MLFNGKLKAYDSVDGPEFMVFICSPGTEWRSRRTVCRRIPWRFDRIETVQVDSPNGGCESWVASGSLYLSIHMVYT